MAYNFQVAVDAAQPHVLAGWWADALGWEVEEQDESFIRQMIAEGYASEQDTMTYDGKLVWTEGAAIRHPGPADGSQAADGNERQRIYFQLVPESKTVKNRLHLDVQVGADNVEAEVARLTASGGSFLYRASQGPHGWVTMSDPEGNEFCVT